MHRFAHQLLCLIQFTCLIFTCFVGVRRVQLETFSRAQLDNPLLFIISKTVGIIFGNKLKHNWLPVFKGVFILETLGKMSKKIKNSQLILLTWYLKSIYSWAPVEASGTSWGLPPHPVNAQWLRCLHFLNVGPSYIFLNATTPLSGSLNLNR